MSQKTPFRFASDRQQRLLFTACTYKEARCPRARKSWCHASDNVASPSGELKSKAEASRLLQRVAAMIADAEDLLPYDREAFTLPLAIWKLLGTIQAQDRLELLDVLPARDIQKLWELSSNRYRASELDKMSVMGPEYETSACFLSEPGKVTTFRGKASLPAFNRFKKLFFANSRSQLLGHVDTGLTRMLFPLFFRCDTKESLFPGTNSLTDMQLSYLPLSYLQIEPADIPPGLPKPREPRWPFSGGLVDYMRAVGPGVFVGRGWKQPTSNIIDGSGFLYFILVRQP